MEAAVNHPGVTDHAGRPELQVLLKAAVEAAQRADAAAGWHGLCRIAVAVCGPQALVHKTYLAAAEVTVHGKVDVHVHRETFDM